MSEDTKEELLWIIECRDNPAWGAATIVRYAARVKELEEILAQRHRKADKQAEYIEKLEAENQRLRDAGKKAHDRLIALLGDGE